MGKCLDAAGGGTAKGTKVHIWTCHGGAHQVRSPTKAAEHQSQFVAAARHLGQRLMDRVRSGSVQVPAGTSSKPTTVRDAQSSSRAVGDAAMAQVFGTVLRRNGR